MLYLKIINTFWKNDICIFKLSKELKNGIEILVGQASYGSKQSTCCFDQ